MKYVVAVDFGSTFTKVVAADLTAGELILSDKVPSTVGTDASIGLEKCFALAKEAMGEKAFGDAAKLATSSAAGGLRMSVVGLTDSLSTMAGKGAALGAGAKIIGNYSGVLTDKKLRRLEESHTEIVLFCGGYEHGNTGIVLQNAEKLAASGITVPVMYCGNSDICQDVRHMMMAGRKQCYVVENIIPKLRTLNVEPTQEIIRNLFLTRITDMKGLSAVKQCFDNDLMPTPAAVLAAGTLLNKGTDRYEGFGPVLIADVGGATTDVYSFNENRAVDGARKIGLEEPFSKRTVEGDLGMRETSGEVLRQGHTREIAAELGISEEQLISSVENRVSHIDFLPDSDLESSIDDAIASLAVATAVRRHAGKVEESFSRKTGMIQTGKNLTGIERIIGTGGILVYNDDPAHILRSAQKTAADRKALIPEKLETWLDSEYVLFAAGLISETDEDAAMELMLNSIRKC